MKHPHNTNKRTLLGANAHSHVRVQAIEQMP